MGILGWLFRRETPEQRIARAREAIAEDEPERALKLLVGIDGDAARELTELARAKAEGRAPREARGLSISFGADGSQTIGGVVLNAPREEKSDDDGRERRTDGLAVARALVAALAADDAVEVPTYPFVDAALLLARAGEAIPACTSARRARLVELCVAAARGDHAKVIALADRRADLAVALVLRHAPALLADVAPDNLDVLRAIAAVDRARAAEMLAAMTLDGAELGEATLAAMDGGLDHAALHARWPATGCEAFEVRRLARVDLEAAIAREATLDRAEVDAAHAVAARLAAIDLPRAIAIADARGPHIDHVGWFRGCTGARTQAAAESGVLVDRWLAALSPSTYDPYAVFRACVAASVRLGDPARVGRAIEIGGPTGWQVAHAARWDLANAADAPRFVAALYARAKPGFVSARGVDGIGLAVGKVVVRPPWLRLTEPHPIETLAITAALGADGPAWFPAALP